MTDGFDRLAAHNEVDEGLYRTVDPVLYDHSEMRWVVPVEPDYMLAMVTYLMESGQRTKLRDVRKAIDAALGIGEKP